MPGADPTATLPEQLPSESVTHEDVVDITSSPASEQNTSGAETPSIAMEMSTTSAANSAIPSFLSTSLPSPCNDENPGNPQTNTIPDCVIDPRLRDTPNTDHLATENMGSAEQIQEERPELLTPARTRSSSVVPLRLFSSDDSSLFSTPSGASSLSSSPFSSPTKPMRQRATKANPCFGEVVGVYRGNKLLTVHRTCHRREQKQRRKDAKNNTIIDETGTNIPKLFYDRTRRFMTKLEDLAEDTGAWVHFSAQHPTANEPFIHFTSRRLRTEGGELLDNLHQANHQLYTSLMTARRCDTSQLAAKLASANEELARVNAEAEAKIAEARQFAAKEVETQLAEANAAKEAAEKDFRRVRAALELAGIVIPGLTSDKS
ncbi:hypothetical protein VNI00_007187 [Paramarasmius palmivorus]|uniref:Uncharacterized protein n=1 Tax=Paramarasmius palmivorus TaxID=297713 RepID=A0AAW0D544_9AGAR